MIGGTTSPKEQIPFLLRQDVACSGLRSKGQLPPTLESLAPLSSPNQNANAGLVLNGDSFSYKGHHTVEALYFNRWQGRF
jgi:hypothetical protein